AKIGFITSKREIDYTDVWTWSGYQVGLEDERTLRISLPLDGEIVDDQADKRDASYWEAQSTEAHPQKEALVEANSNQNTPKILEKGMKAMGLGYQIPAMA
ncbi:hypothetical protein RZS08_57305, partial [Arthrospira platensis SPKY1]|nr:hypothetical protein [Arthrospira platensis SPKY1]